MWGLTKSVSDEDALQVPPRWRGVGRVLVMALVVLVTPVVLVLKRLLSEGACRRLRREATELWQTSPYEAVAAVRAVHERLGPHHRFGRSPFRPFFGARVVIPPYGGFRPVEALLVLFFLYDLEFAIGHYESALDLARESVGGTPDAVSIKMQVDCLVAMKRMSEAVALLQSNLHLDDESGKLRKRLDELGGEPPRPS